MSTVHSTFSLDELVQHRQPQSISLVLPTYKSGRRVTQNAIRFKNLLNEAVDDIVKTAQSSGEASEQEIQRQLSPLFDLQRDDAFWQHQSEGVAVYFCDGEWTSKSLDHSPQPLAYVADHYWLTPVAVDAARRQNFDVLALSWKEAGLFVYQPNRLEAVDSDLFPVTLRDVVLPPDAEEQLQFRTQPSGAASVLYHGQGEGEEMLETDRRRFFSIVGKRVRDVLGDDLQRLVVVATDEVAGHFQAASSLRPSQCVAMSPAGLSGEQLRQRLADRLDDNGLDESLEQLGTALAQQQGSKELPEILAAASQGRVAKLWIDPQQRVWGTWDADSQTMHRSDNHDGCHTGEWELLNWAVIATLQTGGEIAVGESQRLGSPLAAIFRY